jgi:hypothetical protein
MLPGVGGVNSDTINATGTVNAPTLNATSTVASGAATVALSAQGTNALSYVLWGTGNGAGLAGVLGLYDGTRGELIWNTNSVGDMFFNCPIGGGNVSGGVGATARITAAGLIDATAYSVAGTAGASGSYTTADSKTVTVVNGLITAIA